jgi:hypothetical protein
MCCRGICKNIGGVIMGLKTVAELIKDVEHTEYLIKAGRESVYFAVLNDNFEKAKTTALQVQEKEKELKVFMDQLVRTKEEE